MPSSGNTITADHRGPAVDITVWSCFVVSGLAVTSKVWTKFNRTGTRNRLGSLQLDDHIMTLALLFTLAFSVAVSQQVAAGLGSPLEKADLVKYEKTAYVSQIFYALAMCTTNAAGIMFGLMLQPTPTRVILLRGTLALNAFWFLASLFTICFQCRLPHPWEIYSGHCIEQTAFWISFESIDLLVNIVLAGTLCSIIWILQMSSMKYLLVGVFAARSLLAIPMAFKLEFLCNHWKVEPKNATEAMLTAAILNANIVLTCLPFLKPLMEYLMPGWSTSDMSKGFLRSGFGQSDVQSRSGISQMRSRSQRLS